MAFDLSNVNLGMTAVSTITVGGIALAAFKNASKIVKFIEEHKSMVKEFFTLLPAFKEFLKSNQPAAQVVQNVVQAAEIDNGDLRDAKIKAALQLIPQALGVEVASLSNIPVPMIVKYLTDRLPEYSEFITPVSVTAALQTIGSEVQAARAHDGVKMMQEILAYMQQAAPTVAPQTEAVPQVAPEASSTTTPATVVV